MSRGSFAGPHLGAAAARPLRLCDVVAATGATPVEASGADHAVGAPVHVHGISTDSRTLEPGCLFVALRGVHFDGHAFAQDAMTRGAVALLVDAAGAGAIGDGAGVPRLVVADTQTALGQLAAWYRCTMAAPLVAVTGSNGKTTTKEMLAAILAERGQVHKTDGNLNNLIGVPQTLLAWPPSAWACVLEMGMSAAGEIAQLTAMARPDVGLITCVGPAHLEGMGSLEAIAQAKCELFDGLSDDGIVCFNADDPLLVAHAAKAIGARRVLRFGTGEGCEVRVGHVVVSGAVLHLTLAWRAGPELAVHLPLPGRHNALNAAGAAAAATAMGMAPEDIVRGLARVSVPGSRLRIMSMPLRQVNVLDDAYNANPASVRAALATLAEVGAGSRQIVALGDMLELGPQSAELHAQVGQAAAEAGVALVFAVGRWGEDVVRGCRRAGGRAAAFGDYEAFERAVLADVLPGDWILVKGSRGMRMDRLVATLEGSRTPHAASPDTAH